MRDQMQKRLQELKTEYEAGQTMLAEMEAKQANLERTLLRIMGAIQVLEELLVSEAQPESTDSVAMQPSTSVGSDDAMGSIQQVNTSHE